MDIDIVNTILRLCVEQQTYLFEVPFLCDYCLEKRLCKDPKHVMASIKNYMEIFKISRDQNRIELMMPFEICRNHTMSDLSQNHGNICQQFHLCYEFLCTNHCRRGPNCPYPHLLSEKYHGALLGTLLNLDLEILTKAFRVFCQKKKPSLAHSSSNIGSRGGTSATPSSASSLMGNPLAPPSSSSVSSNGNNWRLTHAPLMSALSSWRTPNGVRLTAKIASTTTTRKPIHQLTEKGLQIFWTPNDPIPLHFLEIVFTNENRSQGGPLRSQRVYQHLGIAQLFYQVADVADRVLEHGPVKFQSFQFQARLLKRSIDLRHLCFANVPRESQQISRYIDRVSTPYTKHRFEYYHDDQEIIVVEYNEDIDFSKISANVRCYPECDGAMIQCIQLYHPETLLVEYDRDYSGTELMQLFDQHNVFHIKTYSFCAFVHFYSHDDLLRCMNHVSNDLLRVTPIYIDIYSQRHLENYLRQREFPNSIQPEFLPVESQDESVSPPADEPSQSDEDENSPLISDAEQPSEDVHQLPEPTKEEEEKPTPAPTTMTTEPKTMPNGCLHEASAQPKSLNPSDAEAEKVTTEHPEPDLPSTDDDFNDLPMNFDDEDIIFDESMDTNGDIEFLRSAAKNLMCSLTEMEAANNQTQTKDAPQSFLYGDDYVVTIKNRKFATAFLDYTQFRVEKQRNPDKFRLLETLKKKAQEKRQNKVPQEQAVVNEASASPSTPVIEPELLSMIDTKPSKKRRHKRNKKKKGSKSQGAKDESEVIHESGQEEEDEENENGVASNGVGASDANGSVPPRKASTSKQLPDVILDNDMKPCIFVSGEEHGRETIENDDWLDIKAGGKTVYVGKSSQEKKVENPKKDEATASATPSTKINESKKSRSATSIPLVAQPTEPNAVIVPVNCRGFVHQAKLYEAFRSGLRRSFPSVNLRFQANTYQLTVDGSQKQNVQLCLNYLRSFASHKRTIEIKFDAFPPTTISNIIRMQQSTAQVKLHSNADYNRIFRSTARLLDFQLKQQFSSKYSLYCRRSNKGFLITFLEFPADKGNIAEFRETVAQRTLHLLQTRYVYIAIALSADLIRTKRWMTFFKTFLEHKELNKTILIRKIDTIIQIYGSHPQIHQIQTSISEFLDANRYEIDTIKTEQAREFYLLFKKDFEEMENAEVFREAELRFIYRHRRGSILVQCFQEKFEAVKNYLEKLRSQLSTVVLPIKSPSLSRHFAKSSELRRIEETSGCIMTVEERIDPSRPKDYLINVKIFGRSAERTNRAQQMIREFEEKNYSSRRIHRNDMDLLSGRDMELLQKECQNRNFTCIIDRANKKIDLEGPAGQYQRMEEFIENFFAKMTRKGPETAPATAHWFFYENKTNRLVPYEDSIRTHLDTAYQTNPKGKIELTDSNGHVRTFDFGKMIETFSSNEASSAPKFVKIERRDLRHPQMIPLPAHWNPMNNPWERVLLGKRENAPEWKTNAEIQRVLRLPNMLPEAWIMEVYRIQNARMYQQYVAYREILAARSPYQTEQTLYRLVQSNLIDDMCANGFNAAHNDNAFSAYGHGCHLYCKAIDIHRTATLLAQNFQSTPLILPGQSPAKPPTRYLAVCKVLVGRYTRGEASMKTCPSGFDSTVDNTDKPEIFVTYHDAQVLPEYLLAYQSAIF